MTQARSLKEAERMIEQQRLLNLIKSLTAEKRAEFDKWYSENKKIASIADWPGFKKDN